MSGFVFVVSKVIVSQGWHYVVEDIVSYQLVSLTIHPYLLPPYIDHIKLCVKCKHLPSMYIAVVFIYLLTEFIYLHNIGDHKCLC